MTFLTDGTAVKFTGIDHTFNAVSYTHLDVYKRQICNSTKPFSKLSISTDIEKLLNGDISSLIALYAYCSCLLYTSRCV